MNKIERIALAVVFLSTIPGMVEAKQWTLQDCVDYALENNISLQKIRLQKQSAIEDVLQSKAALLPSLSANTSQNITYNPWPQSGRATIAGDYIQTSVDKIYYNGTYNLEGSWTVWNGNRNHNTLKLNQLVAEQEALDSAVQARSIQEQIAQYYVQILYSTEAVKVSRESYAISKKNEERGKTMVSVGKMSKSELAQLTAQRAEDEYDIVSAESEVKNYKRQLKELLQITGEDTFDVAIPTTTDDLALQEIPTLNSIYAAALDNRPEIKMYQNSINQSDLNIQIAKAQKLPTITASAGLGTSTTTMSSTAWGKQLKSNLDLNGGLTISIPIFDQRTAKTAINKAIIQKQSSLLDLKNEQTTLYSTIENYWLQATTEQNQFKAAKISTESAQTSYDLLSEQFRLGLKNIVELRTGKDNLLKAKQNELQAKYLTILNIDMLNFYKNGILK